MYQNRLEPSLKDVTGFMVPSVIFLSIDAVQVAHADGQIGIGRFDHEVVVVIHEAIGVADPVVPLNNCAEDEKEYLPILIVAEYLVPRIPARGNMINSFRIFNS